MTTLALLAVLYQGGPSAGLDPVLNDLSHRAVRFFWEQSNPKTGLTLDRASNTKDEPRKEYVASIAATGFALSALAIGSERGWLDKQEALDRARLTLRTLTDFPFRSRGWFLHFIDWESGGRLWKCEVSTIDSSILWAGMLIAERYFKDPAITKAADRILADVDWDWMRTDGGAKPESTSISMGWHPETGFIKARWDSYNELMLLYVLALGTDKSFPDKSWTDWKRPEIEYKGHRLFVGGPLFLHQMSHVFYDFADRRDGLGYDYWVAARNATLANRQYCIDNPKGFAGYGPDVWGLSACDGPDGYNAFGAPGWISDDGTMAPAAAVASLIFTPSESLAAAKGIKTKFPETYGRYGFTTGFNPTRKWQSPDVIGIDLGQMMLAIENHRDGLPYRLSMSHPVNRRGMERAGFRVTKEGPREQRALKVASR